MTGISPNYSDWRKLSSIAIWEIACLMQGFDPRAVMAGEVIVRDPSDPTGSTGMEPDTAWEERMLISAVCTQDLLSAPGNCTAPDRGTKVSRISLVPWLYTQAYEYLAGELDTSSADQKPQSASALSASPAPSEPERRLKALRDLGGKATWKHRNGSQQWYFTKIGKLSDEEKRRPGGSRNDMKTIRKDLREAAEAERVANGGGWGAPLLSGTRSRTI